MSEVIIYLFAPHLEGRGRKAKFGRAVKIERATFGADGNGYTSSGVIADGFFECPPDTPDACFIIRGQIVGSY